MGYGYTFGTAKRLKAADGGMLGVQLGRLCVRQDGPVSWVAAELGVSRQTVYNWFFENTVPDEDLAPAIEALIKKIRT